MEAHNVEQGKSREHNVSYQILVCDFMRGEDVGTYWWAFHKYYEDSICGGVTNTTID
jgi:hypothetical protein